MDSTPDQPAPSPEESRDGSTPEPVVPAPEPVVPPADANPPAAPVPGNPYAAGLPVPAPGQPVHPAQPGQWPQPGHPGQPGQWQQPGQPGPLGYVPGAWMPPAPAKKGLSFGAGLGIGLAISVVAHLFAVGVMFASLGAANGNGGALVMLWPFLLIALAAIVMMFFRPTRSYATGILIIAAALWLVIIGPCIVILSGLS